MWQLGQQLLTAAWKIDDLVRDEIFNLLERLQIYNSFSKSKKLVFSMHGAWHCPNTAPIMVHGQALRIITWRHPLRGHPLFVSWMCWTILLVELCEPSSVPSKGTMIKHIIAVLYLTCYSYYPAKIQCSNTL